MAIHNFNVGVKAAIVKDGKLLVIKHAGKGYWDLPGGRVDDDETLMQTLARELSEELPGVEVHGVGDIVTAFRVPGVEFENGSGLMLVVYKVDAGFDGDTVPLSDEHSDAKWITFDAVSELEDSLIVVETVNALRNT